MTPIDVMESGVDEDLEAPFLSELVYHKLAGARLRENVISLVLGNVFTVAILLLIYFNYVLFESCITIFMYSLLVSEALWDTKQLIVNTLFYLNDSDISPKSWVQTIFRTKKLLSVFFLALSIAISSWLRLPFAALFLCASIGTILLLFYILDRKIFVLTRIHRVILTDHTFVAFLLISSVMVVGILLAVVFASSTIADLQRIFDWSSTWVENKLIRSNFTQEIWRDVSLHSGDWMSSFEAKYIANTTYEPVYRWAFIYLGQSRRGANTENGLSIAQSPAISPTESFSNTYREEFSPANNSAEMNYSADFWGWLGFPSALYSWWNVSSKGNYSGVWTGLLEWGSLIVASLEDVTLSDVSEVSASLRGALVKARDGFWATALILASFLFLLIDFGFRLVFFFSVTFILLRSENHLMDELLTGFFESYAIQEESEPIVATSQKRYPADDLDAMQNKASKSVDGKRKHHILSHEAGNFSEGNDVVEEMYMKNLVDQLRHIMEGVLMLPIKMSVYHAASTVVLFKLFNLELIYLGASASIFFTVFPIVYANWICVPWCFTLLLNGDYMLSMLLLLLHSTLYNIFDQWVLVTFNRKWQSLSGGASAYSAVDHSKNGYVTGLSVFFGVSAFGIDGVLLGPLIFCLGTMTYDVLRVQRKSVAMAVDKSGAPSTRKTRCYSRPRKNVVEADAETLMEERNPDYHAPGVGVLSTPNGSHKPDAISNVGRISFDELVEDSPDVAKTAFKTPIQKRRKRHRLSDSQFALDNLRSVSGYPTQPYGRARSGLWDKLINTITGPVVPFSVQPGIVRTHHYDTDRKQPMSSSERDQLLDELKAQFEKGKITERAYNAMVAKLMGID